MEKQLIISIGRECGSGGHAIGQLIANNYGLPMYDRNLLNELAAAKGLNLHDLTEFDEVKRRRFFNRRVKDMHSSIEHNVAELQFNYLKEKAENGESFVIIGRCAETILKGHPALISVFVLGEREAKIQRIMRVRNKNHKDAAAKCDEIDRARKLYHNSHCKGKWGDSRNYDLSINSTFLGLERTAEFLIKYIDERRK